MYQIVCPFVVATLRHRISPGMGNSVF